MMVCLRYMVHFKDQNNQLLKLQFLQSAEDQKLLIQKKNLSRNVLYLLASNPLDLKRKVHIF